MGQSTLWALGNHLLQKNVQEFSASPVRTLGIKMAGD